MKNSLTYFCHFAIRSTDGLCSPMVPGHPLAVSSHYSSYRHALGKCRTHTAFSARQEKLLQGLMTEIVRMTSQMQPLEVGVPLYPFSHTTLFSKDGSGAVQQDPIETPLPDGRTFDEENSAMSPSSISGLTGSSMGPSSVSSPLSHMSPPSSSSMLSGWATGKDVRMPNSGIPPSALYGQSRPSYPH